MKTRENGESTLLCTSLYNRATPFIRYDIGDSVELVNWNNQLHMRSIRGRVNDLVVLPSGRVAAGLTFYYVSRRILETTGCLREFVIRQTAPSLFEFDVVAQRRLTAAEIGDLQRAMGQYLEPGLTVRINYVDQIARTGHGKLKHFTCEMA